jgi:hypothetical protein
MFSSYMANTGDSHRKVPEMKDVHQNRSSLSFQTSRIEKASSVESLIISAL